MYFLQALCFHKQIIQLLVLILQSFSMAAIDSTIPWFVAFATNTKFLDRSGTHSTSFNLYVSWPPPLMCRDS